MLLTQLAKHMQLWGILIFCHILTSLVFFPQPSCDWDGNNDLRGFLRDGISSTVKTRLRCKASFFSANCCFCCRQICTAWNNTGTKWKQISSMYICYWATQDNLTTWKHQDTPTLGLFEVNILWMPVVWCSQIIPNRCTICQRAISWVVPGYEHPFYQLKIPQARRTKRQHCFGSWKVVGFCHKQFLTHLVENVGIPGRVALAVAEVGLMGQMLVKNHGSIFFATLNKGKLVATEHEKCTMFYIVWSML